VEGISAPFQPHYNVKNYDENSNISPCRNIILKKNPLKKKPKILQNIIITLELISSFNTKPKYHVSKILT
jgi:hypothetical protein